MKNLKYIPIELNYGKWSLKNKPIKTEESKTFLSKRECLVEMYYQKIVNNKLCWYNSPADPGIVCNDLFTEENLQKIRDKRFIETVMGKVTTDLENREGSQSIEAAVDNLLIYSQLAVSYLEAAGADSQVVRELKWAIGDVIEWKSGIEEQSGSYFNRYIAGDR